MFLKDIFNKFGTDYAFAGWSICFDISFFRKICIENSFNNEYRKIDYHNLDIQLIARYLETIGIIRGSISLDNLCKSFSLNRLEKHNSLEDAKLSFELFKKLIGLYIS